MLPELDTQVQLQVKIDAVHAFMVPPEALHVAQVKVTQAKSPVAVVVRLNRPGAIHMANVHVYLQIRRTIRKKFEHLLTLFPQ